MPWVPCPPLWVGMVEPHAHAKPWAWHPARLFGLGRSQTIATAARAGKLCRKNPACRIIRLHFVAPAAFFEGDDSRNRFPPSRLSDSTNRGDDAPHMAWETGPLSRAVPA